MAEHNGPRVAVIQFPGSNCEQETARALESAGCRASLFRWNRGADELTDVDAVVVGGGFSYQDRVRSGAIAAHAAISERLFELAAGGTPILGICNGAQVLVEMGLVPGIEPGAIEMALAPNMMMRDGQVVRRDYYCSWVHLRLSTAPQRCAFTRAFAPDAMISIPMAHGEGRFVTRDADLLDQLEADGQVVWRYCDADGDVSEQFPITPNGSSRAIAGLMNPAGNVLALMPHPERANWLRQVPQDLPGPYGQQRRAARGDAAALEGAGPGRGIFDSLRLALTAPASA